MHAKLFAPPTYAHLHKRRPLKFYDQRGDNKYLNGLNTVLITAITVLIGATITPPLERNKPMGATSSNFTPHGSCNNQLFIFNLNILLTMFCVKMYHNDNSLCVVCRRQNMIACDP